MLYGYGDAIKVKGLTTLDFRQSIDAEFNIKLLVASVHNLRVLLIFFDFILFVS